MTSSLWTPRISSTSGGTQVPSKSAAQAKLMRAAAHDKEFAKKVGIRQSIAREFVEADKRKKKGKK